MKAIAASTVFCAALLASSSWAADTDPMANYYANTLVVHQPDGYVMKIYYDADHTVHYVNTNGRSDKGTWKQKDAATVCTVIRQAVENPKPAFEECFPNGNHKLGDKWPAHPIADKWGYAELVAGR